MKVKVSGRNIGRARKKNIEWKTVTRKQDKQLNITKLSLSLSQGVYKS